MLLLIMRPLGVGGFLYSYQLVIGIEAQPLSGLFWK